MPCTLRGTFLINTARQSFSGVHLSSRSHYYGKQCTRLRWRITTILLIFLNSWQYEANKITTALNHVKFRFAVLTSSAYSQQVSRLFIFTWSHSDTHHTFGRIPLDEWSARRRCLYLTTQTLTRDRHLCLPVWFEPTITTSARPQTYVLDRAATGIGLNHVKSHLKKENETN
jgi:hypothetical protein